MEKSKLAYFADEILRAAAIWLLSAICIRYVIKELYLIILLATAITMLASLLLRRYYEKKNMTQKILKQTDEAMRELIAIDREVFIKALSEKLSGRVEDDIIVTYSTVVYPYFFGKVPIDSFNKAYNFALKNNKKLLVLCCEISIDLEKSLDLFSDIPVCVLTKKKSYEFLSKYELLPQIKKRTRKKLTLLKSALKKNKIKGYLTAALILLITAAFSPYAIVCIFAAAANIALSIVCEIKGEKS